MNWSLFHEQIFPIRHKLYRFALRITGNAHEAEDVVQEVLERVWKTPVEQSETVKNWEAWCMALTRNRSVDRTRALQLRRVTPLDALSDRPGLTTSPAQQLETLDLTQKIRKLMEDLPEKQRLVMFLRDVEELTYEEISETLDISMDQVKVNLHRARKTIRSQMIEIMKENTSIHETSKLSNY